MGWELRKLNLDLSGAFHEIAEMPEGDARRRRLERKEGDYAGQVLIAVERILS